MKLANLSYLTIAIFISCSNNSNVNEPAKAENNKTIIVDTVFVIDNSHKGTFHKSIECHSIARTIKEVLMLDSTLAVDSGYKPCGFCYSKPVKREPKKKMLRKPKAKKKSPEKSTLKHIKTPPRDFLSDTIPTIRK